MKRGGSDLELWCCKWDMQINFKKTTYVHIRKKKNVLNFQYNLGSNNLCITSYFKYLEVTITNNLTWHRLIESVCSESFKKLCHLRAKLHKTPKHVKLLAYQTYIRPRLEYASVVWSPHQKHLVTKLERIQRRAALIWTPAHVALEGNERANEAARDLTHREPPKPGSQSMDNAKDRLCAYRDVLEHYKGERRTYPAAHPSLPKKQEVAWRRLQTNTYPNPGIYRHFHPDIHDGKCKHCPEIASLTHMLWECPSI
ncbi:uncharacterized protein LOC144143183 [Haemaphysalis longicornis]